MLPGGNLGERQRHPNDPSIRRRECDVPECDADRGTDPRRGADGAGERLPDLRAGRVVLHGRRVVLGVREHDSIGPNDGDAVAARGAEPPHLLLQGAAVPREGLLDRSRL